MWKASTMDFTRPPEKPRDGYFGGWTVNEKVLALDHEMYQVDLQRCSSAAAVLDWICQVSMKVWADDAELAGLVRLLNATLRPQETGLCGLAMGQAQEPASKTRAKLKRQLDENLRSQLPMSDGTWK